MIIMWPTNDLVLTAPVDHLLIICVMRSVIAAL
jgi:hypothetical protein